MTAPAAVIPLLSSTAAQQLLHCNSARYFESVIGTRLIAHRSALLTPSGLLRTTSG